MNFAKAACEENLSLTRSLDVLSISTHILVDEKNEKKIQNWEKNSKLSLKTILSQTLSTFDGLQPTGGCFRKRSFPQNSSFSGRIFLAQEESQNLFRRILLSLRKKKFHRIFFFSGKRF